MPRARVRQVAGISRRSNSVLSEPVGNPRTHPRVRRGRQQHVVSGGRVRRPPRTTIPRSQRRNHTGVDSSGQINRRNNRREISSIHMLTSRESLDILRCYLIDCERNLIECQQQRGRLAHMVKQLIKDENRPNAEAEIFQTTVNVTQVQVQPTVDVDPLAQSVMEPTPELSELITSVRFVAEHRGEDTEQTLNELMRLRNETSPTPLETEHDDATPNVTQPYGDDVDDFVVQGCEFNTVSQMNGILTVVFGLDDGDQGGVNADSADGSNQV